MANDDIPAGWYPDPSGGGGDRWWDGAGWTEHVRSHGTAAAVQQPLAPEESEPEPVAVETPIPAGWYPDPAGSGGQRWWDGFAWTDHVQAPPGAAAETETAVLRQAEGAEDTEVIAAPAALDEVTDDPSELGSSDDDADLGVADGANDDLAGDVDAGTAPGGVEDLGEEQHAEAGSTAPGAIPAGWYADPSGHGERWWTGDAWSEHVRTPSDVAGERGGSDASGHEPVAPEAQPTGDEPTEAIPPVDQTAAPAMTPGADAAAGPTAGAASVASQGGDQGRFTMTGVGAAPPTGPPPDDDDGGSGGSRKLIVLVVLFVVLLAAVGAALWFVTDVFDQAEPVSAAAEEPEEPAIEEEQAPPPDEEPEPTYASIRDADLAAVAWSTTCIGTETSPGTRASQPQPVTFDGATSALLWHDNPHHPSGLPAYAVDLGSVQYGDATGDGNEDAAVVATCEDAGATAIGLEVWSLDGEGRPFQQPTPPLELATGEANLISFEVEGGRLVVTVGEVQDDGTEVAVVTEYGLSGLVWVPNELGREEPPVAVQEDAIPGIGLTDFQDGWSFLERPTPQAPLLATHDELPATFIIALDESLLGWAGPDLGLGELADEWFEILEAVAEDEGADLPADWFSDVEVEGTETAVQVLYEGPSAEVNYYLLIAEVGDLVVEISVQVGQDGWVEDELREDVLEMFASLSFDPDVLMAAYEGG